MKKIYLTAVKYIVLDTMEITKITGQNEMNRQSTDGAQTLTSITTLHIDEIQADHVDDGSKARAYQKAYPRPGGGKAEVREGEEAEEEKEKKEEEEDEEEEDM